MYIDAVDGNGELVPFLRVERPYRFYWHEVNVFDNNHGRNLGCIRRRFAWCSREYDVFTSAGELIFAISSGLFEPWTFALLIDGEQVGQISKKWSGAAQELFTDADNFGVELPQGLPPGSKALLLAAVFLIDFMYFEDNNQKKGGGFRRF
jgi:hypothetical protein